MSILGDRISFLMKKNKLSQQELADKIGVTRSAIGMYKCGDSTPSIGVLEKMANVFGVSVDYLLGRTELVYIPKEWESNVKYMEVIKEWKDEGKSPEDIKEMLETVKSIVKKYS